jgi:hypothetical protein
MEWLVKHNSENSLSIIHVGQEHYDTIKQIVIDYQNDVDQMMKEISNYDHHEIKTLDLLGCLITTKLQKKSGDHCLTVQYNYIFSIKSLLDDFVKEHLISSDPPQVTTLNPLQS